jgi:hypothetical protein
MIGVAALVLSTTLVVWAAFLGARLARAAEGIERALAVATLTGVGVIVCSLIAGLVGAYTPLGLTVTAAVLAATAALAHRVLLGSLPWPSSPRLPMLQPWQIALTVLAALALAWRVVLALVLPPFAYDALTYHVTAIAHWVESDTIGANTYSFCCARYPSNGELLDSWLAVFSRSDTLVDASQVAATLLGALAVAALARWLGVTPGGAVAAGALFVTTPIVLTQANTPYVDVTFVAFLLASAAFLVRFLDADPFGTDKTARRSQLQPGLLVLSGLAAGVAFGAKHFALPAVGVLSALLVAHVVVARARRRLGTGRGMLLVVIFASCCILVGGSWYLRSWIDTRNPVWPAAVHIGHTTVFAGRRELDDLLTVPPGGNRAWPYEVGRSWAHDLAFWTRRDYSYEERDGGLGPVWSWLGLPALLALAWWAIRRRPVVAVNLLAPFALLYAVQPYRWWSRFTIYLPALAAPAIVLGIERLPSRALARALAVATVLLAVVGVALATWRLDPAGRARVIDMRDVVGLVDAPARERTAGALFFPEYQWLERVPLDAPVAVEEFAPSIRFVYPFLAPRFDRRVDLLTGSPGRRTSRRLARDRIRFLAVERGGTFDRWASRQPRAFESFYTGHGVRVFRLQGATYSLRP